jgi:hypothetical protein
MSNLIAMMEMPAEANPNRAKAKLLLRRRRRTAVRRLLKALTTVQNQDDREATRATLESYQPFLVRGNENSLDDRAFKRLMSRCVECLAKTA